MDETCRLRDALSTAQHCKYGGLFLERDLLSLEKCSKPARSYHCSGWSIGIPMMDSDNPVRIPNIANVLSSIL